MKTLTLSQMCESNGNGVVGCVASLAGFTIATATLLTFSGGFLAFAGAYVGYYLSVDSVLSLC